MLECVSRLVTCLLPWLPSLLLPRSLGNGKLVQGTRTLQGHTSPLLGKGGTVDGVMSLLCLPYG